MSGCSRTKNENFLHLFKLIIKRVEKIVQKFFWKLSNFEVDILKKEIGGKLEFD